MATGAGGTVRGGAARDEPRLRLLEGASRRTVVIGLVVGVPVSALCLYLATRRLDLGDVRAALGRAEPSRLVAAVALMAVLYTLQAERWRVVAGPEARVARRRFLALVVGSVAVNNVVPGRPGEILRGYWLSRMARVPVARAFATVIVDRAADVVVLAALLAAVLPWVDHPAWLTRLVLAAGVLALLALAGVAFARWRARRRPLTGDEARGRSAARRHLSTLLRGVADAGAPSRLAGAAVLTAAAWGVFAVGAWLVAGSLGIELSPVEALFVAAAVNLGVMIPSSPGFVGTYQWLGVSALGLFGVARADAFAFALLMQAVWFVPTTLAGLALAARLALPGRARAGVAMGPERNAA